MKFLAKKYLNRTEIEKEILAKVGNDINRNRDNLHIIEGKREDLKRLDLSDLTTVWGIQCVITDTPTPTLIEQRRQRDVKKGIVSPKKE